MPRLLVIDDDEPSCRLVKAIFTPAGFDVVMAHDGETAAGRVLTDKPDVVLLDVGLPGRDGMQVLEDAVRSSPTLPIVMLTASTDVRNAVRAMRLGAFDYLTKPLDQEEILVVVERALATRALHLEVEELRRRVGENEADSLSTLMGPSQQVRHIIGQVAAVASSNFTVLVLGETGTGKELIAQAIHRQSERRRRPFVALDCGAIPEALLESELFGHEKGAFTGADRRRTGQFQLAEGGTCFLDEVGNLPVSLQAKLLRALESRQIQPVGAERATPVDIRLVAATNDDLQHRAHQGQFRADLYFRLAQYTISLPPLRDRPEDIPYLAQRFLDEAGVELRRPIQQLASPAMEMLQKHRWPGNVRELRNVVRQAVLRTRALVIKPADLRAVLRDVDEPPVSAPGGNERRPLRRIAEDAARSAERRAILDALRAAGGNQSRAARALQIDYKTMHVKLKKLGIKARDFQP